MPTTAPSGPVVRVSIDNFSFNPAVVTVPAGGRVMFDVTMKDFDDLPGNLTLGVGLSNSRGQRVVLFHTEFQEGRTFKGAKEMTMTCEVPSLPLVPGSYSVDLVLADGFNMVERVERAANVEVIFNDYFGHGKLPNNKSTMLLLPCSWN
jgi:hypothetical protein